MSPHACDRSPYRALALGFLSLLLGVWDVGLAGLKHQSQLTRRLEMKGGLQLPLRFFQEEGSVSGKRFSGELFVQSFLPHSVAPPRSSTSGRDDRSPFASSL